jgi:hypothetical protein
MACFRPYTQSSSITVIVSWTAKTDLRDLIGRGPDGRPWPWRPRFRYHLLDEQRHDPDRLPGMDNLVAVLVLMEQCRTVEELRVLVDRAVALLGNEAYASPAPGLRHDAEDRAGPGPRALISALRMSVSYRRSGTCWQSA